MESTRAQRIWIAVTVLYALMLVGAALLYALDPDTSTHDKVGYVLAVVALPALVFALAFAPLWRRSRNRVVLVAAAVVAEAEAFFEGMITWGFAFPICVVLAAVGYADLVRAGKLSEDRGVRRTLMVYTPLALLVLAAGIAVPVLAIGALVAAGFAVWNLLRRSAARP
jgi:hypothetical protein